MPYNPAIHNRHSIRLPGRLRSSRVVSKEGILVNIECNPYTGLRTKRSVVDQQYNAFGYTVVYFWQGYNGLSPRIKCVNGFACLIDNTVRNPK